MSENGAESTVEWSRTPDGVMHTNIGSIPVMVKEVQDGKWLGVFNGWCRAFDDMETAMGEAVFMADKLDSYMGSTPEIDEIAKRRGIILEA